MQLVKPTEFFGTLLRFVILLLREQLSLLLDLCVLALTSLCKVVDKFLLSLILGEYLRVFSDKCLIGFRALPLRLVLIGKG